MEQKATDCYAVVFDLERDIFKRKIFFRLYVDKELRRNQKNLRRGFCAI
jgi:hypothetical protein